jgi:hypothetical protein
MASAIHHLIEFAALLPHVDRPLPRTIGLGFPFSTAGAFGLLATLARAEASSAEQDRAIRLAGIFGFWVGFLFYGVALVNQLLSS